MSRDIWFVALSRESVLLSREDWGKTGQAGELLGLFQKVTR